MNPENRITRGVTAPADLYVTPTTSRNLSNRCCRYAPGWPNTNRRHAAAIASRCGSGAGTLPELGRSHMRWSPITSLSTSFVALTLRACAAMS